MGDEHHLHGQVEQRPQSLPELRPAHPAGEVAEPRVGTESQAARVGAEQPVAGDERAPHGEPDHRFPGALDRHRLDALGQGPARTGRGCVVARRELLPAAPVELERRQDRDAAAVAADERVEGIAQVLAIVRDERVDEHERVRGLVGDTADVRAPVGRALRIGIRVGIGMAGRPAVESRGELEETDHPSSTALLRWGGAFSQ